MKGHWNHLTVYFSRFEKRKSADDPQGLSVKSRIDTSSNDWVLHPTVLINGKRDHGYTGTTCLIERRSEVAVNESQNLLIGTLLSLHLIHKLFTAGEIRHFRFDT